MDRVEASILTIVALVVAALIASAAIREPCAEYETKDQPTLIGKTIIIMPVKKCIRRVNE